MTCHYGRVKAEADVLVVSIAEAEELPVVVYDTYTDLLVMFVALARATTKVYEMLQ